MTDQDMPEPAAPDLAAEVTTLRARLVQAELRTEALRAGMVDLDGVRLIDAAGLQLTEAGGVQGGPALMARMRQDKPWLFGRAHGNSSSRGMLRRRWRRLPRGLRWTWGWRSGARPGPSCCDGAGRGGGQRAGHFWAG